MRTLTLRSERTARSIMDRNELNANGGQGEDMGIGGGTAGNGGGGAGGRGAAQPDRYTRRAARATHLDRRRRQPFVFDETVQGKALSKARHAALFAAFSLARIASRPGTTSIARSEGSGAGDSRCGRSRRRPEVIGTETFVTRR